MLKFDAVILAGGQSTRMGQDKGLMPFSVGAEDDKAMVEWVAQSLSCGANELLVNTNEYEAEYQALGFKTIKDIHNPGIGPLVGPLLGIYSGLMATTSDWVLFSPCDTPYILPNYGEKMSEYACQHLSYANVAFDGERRQNLHLLLHRSLADSLLMFLISGGRKTYQWLEAVNAQNVDFSMELNSFNNLNTPTDVKTARV